MARQFLLGHPVRVTCGFVGQPSPFLSSPPAPPSSPFESSLKDPKKVAVKPESGSALCPPKKKERKT